MKATKQAVIVIVMNGRERMAVSYAMTQDMDIRKKCYEFDKLIREAKNMRDAVCLITTDVLRHGGYVYGMSEKTRAAEREELRKCYGMTFADRKEWRNESGLLMFREETIRQARKECDVLAEMCCDTRDVLDILGFEW